MHILIFFWISHQAVFYETAVLFFWSNYKTFMVKVVARTPKFQSYEKTQCRLDTFFFKTIELEHCKRIEKVIRMILCLKHGQAAVERGFNINKNLLQVNMTEVSIVAQRIIYDTWLLKIYNHKLCQWQRGYFSRSEQPEVDMMRILMKEERIIFCHSKF